MPKQRLLTLVLLLLLMGVMVLPTRSFALRSRFAFDAPLEATSLQKKPIVIIGPRYNHLVNEFNEEFSKITGAGVTAAVIDEGAVLHTHQEFRKSSPGDALIRVLTKEPASSHSTTIAAIIAAKGVNQQAKGIASGVSLLSLDWEDDLKKLRSIAPRLQISNHSYAPPGGWYRDPRTGSWVWYGNEKVDAEEYANFGKYGLREVQFDNLLYQFPMLISFVATGSNRNEGPTEQQPFTHTVFNFGQDGLARRPTSQKSEKIHKPNGWDRGGLDTLKGLCLSKNAICVGAIDNITPSRPISIEHDSAWGPADDGRIKPDLVATGANIFSASGADDRAYVFSSGTAMATAVGSGVAALLMQLYRDTRGASRRMPTAAEIKAVLIHTATDAGNRGPDPVFGWGSINTQRAGQVIAHRDLGGKFLHLMETGRLRSSEAKQHAIVATGSRIKVTLVWTDPEGRVNTSGLDDALPVLQNDLDVRLISPEGTVFYPYSLDPQRPLSLALRDGPNSVDNVEVIDVTSELGQTWKLEVRAKKLTVGISQSFALVVSGVRAG